MCELRWKIHTQGQPPQGSIHIGNPGSMLYQYLEYRTKLNPLEEGLHNIIWSEWQRVPSTHND